MPYLGNNFWKLPDGKYFNTKTQMIYSNLPMQMLFDKTIGNYRVYEGRINFPKEYGTKFVTFDMCDNFSTSKTGKSHYANMIDVKLLIKGYDFQKKKKIDHHFEIGVPYILFLQANQECIDGYELLHYKEVV